MYTIFDIRFPDAQHEWCRFCRPTQLPTMRVAVAPIARTGPCGAPELQKYGPMRPRGSSASFLWRPRAFYGMVILEMSSPCGEAFQASPHGHPRPFQSFSFVHSNDGFFANTQNTPRCLSHIWRHSFFSLHLRFFRYKKKLETYFWKGTPPPPEIHNHTPSAQPFFSDTNRSSPTTHRHPHKNALKPIAHRQHLWYVKQLVWQWTDVYEVTPQVEDRYCPTLL